MCARHLDSKDEVRRMLRAAVTAERDTLPLLTAHSLCDSYENATAVRAHSHR